jgi:hypothetical protein
MRHAALLTSPAVFHQLYNPFSTSDVDTWQMVQVTEVSPKAVQHHHNPAHSCTQTSREEQDCGHQQCARLETKDSAMQDPDEACHMVCYYNAVIVTFVASASKLF